MVVLVVHFTSGYWLKKFNSLKEAEALANKWIATLKTAYPDETFVSEFYELIQK